MRVWFTYASGESTYTLTTVAINEENKSVNVKMAFLGIITTSNFAPETFRKTCGMEIVYAIKPFGELTNDELYQVLKLRSDVFVVEQNSIYRDMDNKDQDSYHLLCRVDHKLAGYTRLLPAGLSYADASIGRVVIGVDYRGLSLGKKLMEKSIAACISLFGDTPIRISAQHRLMRFYRELGFKETGAPYDEDGILHIEMVRSDVKYSEEQDSDRLYASLHTDLL